MRGTGLKLFIRNFSRNKLYSSVVVLGFATALTFVILLSVYVRQELAVDSFQENKDRIYRVINEKDYGYSGPMASILQRQFPEIECYSLFMLNKEGITPVSPTEKVRYTYAYVHPTFFKMFTFPLIEGSPEEVMQEKYSMVITQSLARKLFGNESPLGKEIKIAGIAVPVTGVMKDIPENTHFQHFDAAVNIAGLSDYWGWKNGDILEQMGIATFSLYLMAKPGTDLKVREKDMLESFQKNVSQYQREDAPQKVVIEPLEQIYFSAYGGGWGKHNSKSLVLVMAAIVTVVLLLAIINYINLSIAQGGMRAKEISVKKLLGSSRRMLFSQFINESLLLSCIAFLIACGFSVLLEPVFNQLMDTHIEVASAFSPWMLFYALLLIGMVGFISGIVPAWVITRFNAMAVMKGVFRKRTKGIYSKVLISFQFTVAIVLTICTIVLVKQTHFLQHFDMGFNRDHIARFSYVLDAGKKETLRNEVMKLAGVKEVVFACGDPIDGGNNYTFDCEGRRLSFQTFKVDTSFFRVFGLKTVPTGNTNQEGGEYTEFTYSNGKSSRTVLKYQSAWLNEEAVRQLGLGKLPLEFKINDRLQSVCGIVGDFHIRDLTQQLEPLMIYPMQALETPWSMLVQLQGNDQYVTFHEIETVYKKLSEGVPFEAGFLNDTIAHWYDRVDRISSMIGNLCLLTILLSAMGILAMATYFIQQRIKEIGIRRVNGATVQEILQMLMNNFIKWIVLAFFIACPVGYYVMNRWLSDFIYRTSLDWWIFATSGMIAFLIAGLMICWQSWKAATANPVDTLKTE